ncbi:MAG: A/G-specific adenine glycosylase [Candidatus Parcubacteria bacterium]|nr:A/G-specific adenine glycosylase [Candidatus Parcubacteria bacterium]
MSWRSDPTPYRVVISEIMLQQTQVERVMKKFAPFMRRFPDWQTLAQSPTKDVLEEWSGLGYNRRALYLKRIAQIIASGRKEPDTLEKWRELPGIGPNTAGAILAFAFNRPVPFIETNIRAVFIHFFFRNSSKKIADHEILPFVQRALADKKIRANAREWYYALMDYGAHLKKQDINPSRRSAHHFKQKPFKGSNRELRSKILRLILRHRLNEAAILKKLAEYEPVQIAKNIADLVHEGFLTQKRSVYRIT